MMITAIGDGLTAVIGWCGEVVSAITATDGALAPLLAFVGISCAVSATLFGIKVIKSMIWGA